MDNSGLKIGHTAITWASEDVETAVKTISELGYAGVEVFGWTLKTLEAENRLDIFEQYDIPLVSSYFSADILRPEKREDTIARLTSWLEILRTMGCRVVALGGDGIDRRGYNYFEHKKHIVDAVNEYGRLLAGYGAACCFHQHTGTPVESFDETVDFMNSVNTDFVSFGPDVGQISKGGSDPLVVVKDFISIIKHVHLKDYDGIPLRRDDNGKEIDSSGFACYTPLGKGVVNLRGILRILVDNNYTGMVNVELDGGANVPIDRREALAISKDYLLKQGCTFRK